MPKKSKKKKRRTRKSGASNEGRRPGRKPYPVMTFDEAVVIGRGIMDHGAGHPMKRTTLLSKLKLTDNQSTRNLITNSGKYGITKGGYQADQLKLTDLGKAALDPEMQPSKSKKARFDLAIASNDFFMKLYDHFKGGKLPATEVIRDFLTDLHQGDRSQCVDIFVSNANTVGVLQVREGAQNLLTVEQFLASGGRSADEGSGANGQGEINKSGELAPEHAQDFDRVCFFVAPIGSDGSEARQHSDSVLSSFVEPALQEHELQIVRADKITKPGMISGQVIEYVLKSKLVVADLSFHNPNVFYELSLRHATGKPTVHLIRESDTVPFDVSNFRTISIKMDSVYNVLAHLDTYRAEIAQQIRQVLADGTTTNNPILAFCPDGRFVVDSEP